MAVFKCKMCGGTVSIDSSTNIATCDYCGSKQTFPQFSEETETRLFDSGTAFLQQGEYDKAEKVFNQLITIKPSDPELYWTLALCKYGITFVQDPQSKKYIPTCNRTHFESILNDKNYLNAIKY